MQQHTYNLGSVSFRGTGIAGGQLEEAVALFILLFADAADLRVA